MSLRGAQRRSNLNPKGGRLLRCARNDMADKSVDKTRFMVHQSESGGQNMKTWAVVIAVLATLTTSTALAQGVAVPPTRVCQIGSYACPAHPEIRATWPAQCPICHTILAAAQGGGGAGGAGGAAGGMELPAGGHAGAGTVSPGQGTRGFQSQTPGEMGRGGEGGLQPGTRPFGEGPRGAWKAKNSGKDAGTNSATEALAKANSRTKVLKNANSATMSLATRSSAAANSRTKASKSVSSATTSSAIVDFAMTSSGIRDSASDWFPNDDFENRGVR